VRASQVMFHIRLTVPLEIPFTCVGHELDGQNPKIIWKSKNYFTVGHGGRFTKLLKANS